MEYMILIVSEEYLVEKAFYISETFHAFTLDWQTKFIKEMEKNVS